MPRLPDRLFRHPFRSPPARRVGAAVAAGVLMMSFCAVTTAAAGSAEEATIRAASAGLEVSAGYLTLEMDGTGTVTGLDDSRTGRDYAAAGKSASLVSLVIGGEQVRPTKVAKDRDLLVFTNDSVGFEVDVRVEDKAGYATFEAVKVDGPDGADVQTLLWGPLAMSITQTIGETVGVVRDSGFAIGLRPLTDRTEGAWPQEYQQFGFESEVDDNPSKLEVAPHEEFSAAGKTAWGSVLRAFTFDYTKERSRQNRNGYRLPVGPLPGDSGQVTGSKVALFGASPELTPTVLSNIARGEDLPYPTQGGQWQKTAQASSQSFLVLGDLRTTNIPTAAEYATAAGIDYIYSLPNAVGPWQSTGHYQFNSSLGGNDAGARAAVDLAKANGVRIGVHTISDFISTNDPYVSPPADDRLATGGRAFLSRPLGAGDTTLYLDSGALLASGLPARLLRIGDEFVTYGEAKQVGTEWQLTGLQRAQWRSVAASHATGDQAARMVVNQYGGAIGGHAIIDEISTRLSTAWNSTGIMSNSYDGVESASESGWGPYGQALLVNGTYAKTQAKDGYVTETSRMTSNTWDALTRASWGEVASTSMAQVFINNEFYRDNFLPGMLGWISLSGSENLLSVESKLARGAGLNAGAGFQTSVASLAAGGQNGQKVLDAIKQWETARNLGAFTDAQRARLRDRSTNWHLTVVEPGKKWSLQELDAAGTAIGAAQEVVVPAPRLNAVALPPATTQALYEARIGTNTPATVRYEVTGGALPEGLRLNPDTGGIVGKPIRSKNARFTITAHQTGGLPDARADYEINVRTGPPHPEPQLAVTAGGTTLPGVGTEAITEFINGGLQPVHGLEMTLTAPTGWKVEAATPATFDAVPAGGSVSTKWTVTPAQDAQGGWSVLAAGASYRSTGGAQTVEAEGQVTVAAVQPTLKSAFNNVGVTADSNPRPGNYDGAGNSWSEQALAEVGLTPGAAVTAQGVTYTWPDVARGSADNVAGGAATIWLDGQGDRLGVLGSGIGQATGTFTVHYADGTSTAASVTFPNWCCTGDAISGGASLVATARYRNTQNGPANFGAGYRVFAQTIPVDPSKQVVALTLPAESSVHVFAVGLGH